MLPGGETEFDGQSEQVAGPKPALYWLILHCEHAAPFAPAYPALHSQEVSEMLPAGEVELIVQFEQSAGPKPDLYVSALHCEHVPPSVPVNLALHLQSVATMLLSGDVEFTGHCVHVLTLVAWNE